MCAVDALWGTFIFCTDDPMYSWVVMLDFVPCCMRRTRSQARIQTTTFGRATTSFGAYRVQVLAEWGGKQRSIIVLAAFVSESSLPGAARRGGYALPWVYVRYTLPGKRAHLPCG